MPPTLSLAQTRIEYTLYFSVALCWALNIYFLGRFLLAWHEREPEPRKAWLALAAVCLPALVLTFFAAVRGGYDNGHDFQCLSENFFAFYPGNFFREISPLFTDWVSDILSGFSLRAILWKNRLLLAVSAAVFFAGLRRLGAGLAVCGASAAFFLLNFLAVLNANSFSTTSANLLIWLVSLAALFDAFAAPSLGTARLLWIFSSMVLVISARFEFLPANLLLFAALIASRSRTEKAALLNKLDLSLAAVFAALLTAYGIHLSADPGVGTVVKQYAHSFHELGRNLFYQLGTRNFLVVAAASPEWAVRVSELRQAAYSGASAKSAVVCSAFILLAIFSAVAGGLADRRKLPRNLLALSAIGAWAAYFSFIYKPQDLYPLHFMRHQLYYFVPFVYLFALGADGAETLAARLPGRGKTAVHALCAALLASYAALNALAVLRLNSERRTNDLELEFLASAQRDWDPACAVFCPDDGHHRKYLLKKYYTSADVCSGNGFSCLLKYVSPVPEIFRDDAVRAPGKKAAGGAPWRSVSFRHAFYTSTVMIGTGVRETPEPLPLTIGFFRMTDAERSQATSDCARKI